MIVSLSNLLYRKVEIGAQTLPDFNWLPVPVLAMLDLYVPGWREREQIKLFRQLLKDKGFDLSSHINRRWNPETRRWIFEQTTWPVEYRVKAKTFVWDQATTAKKIWDIRRANFRGPEHTIFYFTRQMDAWDNFQWRDEAGKTKGIIFSGNWET